MSGYGGYTPQRKSSSGHLSGQFDNSGRYQQQQQVTHVRSKYPAKSNPNNYPADKFLANLQTDDGYDMSLNGFRAQPTADRQDTDMETFARAHTLCMHNMSQFLTPYNMNMHPEACLAWIQDVKQFCARVENDAQVAIFRKQEHRTSSGQKVRALARMQLDGNGNHNYGADVGIGKMEDGYDTRFGRGKKILDVRSNDTSDVWKEQAMKKRPPIGKRIFPISKEPTQAFNMEPLPPDPNRKTHNHYRSTLFDEAFTNEELKYPTNPHNKGKSNVEFFDFHPPVEVDLSKNTSEKNSHQQKFWDFVDPGVLHRETQEAAERARQQRTNKNQKSMIDLRWHEPGSPSLVKREPNNDHLRVSDPNPSRAHEVLTHVGGGRDSRFDNHRY